MKLQALPRLKRPELRSAEQGLRQSLSQKAHNSVTRAYQDIAPSLAELDGTESDFNSNPGEVVVINKYLSNGPDTAVSVQAAELRFDPETGEVDRFKVIKNDNTSYTYEHKSHDEYKSSNPTFSLEKDGNFTSFDLRSDGLISDFRHGNR